MSQGASKKTSERRTKKKVKLSPKAPAARQGPSEPGPWSSDEWCPLCQMPFKILVVQTRSWHMAECVEVDRSRQKECKISSDCDSTIVGHYLQLTHYRLADRRAGIHSSASCIDLQLSKIPQSSSQPSQTSDSQPENTLITESQTTDSPLIKIIAKVPWSSQPDSLEISKSLQTNSQKSLSMTVKSPAQTDQTLKTGFFKKPGTHQVTIASIFGYPIADRRLDLTNVNDKTSSSVSINEVEVGVVRGGSRRSSTTSAGTKYGRSDSFQSMSDPVADFDGAGNNMKRRCPQYKKLPDVPFTVDAFRYGEIPGILAYFLSHFHYDHYEGLSSKFQGELYCSQVTANLVQHKLRVKDVCLRPLPMDQPRVIHGVEVSLVDANHCPGSVMFVFRYSNGQTVLHTGDFRADAEMLAHPSLKPLRVDYLYLDTTYCQPIYDFPTQKEVLDFVVDLARRQMTNNPKTLFVCGSYTVGKEKVFSAIAHALNMRVFAKTDKRRILLCLDDKPLHNLLSTDDQQSQIHVLRMADLNYKFLQSYLGVYRPRYTHIMALKPTGWEFNSNRGGPGHANRTNLLKNCKFTCREDVTIYGIPYSEHSSFSELRNFVQAVNPVKIIPTVNVSGQRSQAQNDILAGWTERPTSVLKQFQGTINEMLKKPKISL